MMKKLATVAILMWISVAAVVSAATPSDAGTCIVPPDDYFVTDGPANGHVAHEEGLQQGFTFWLTEDQANRISGSYLYDLKRFKLQHSHNDQIKISMGKLMYCYSMSDFPYESEESGNDSRDQDQKDTYVSAADNHAGIV